MHPPLRHDVLSLELWEDFLAIKIFLEGVGVFFYFKGKLHMLGLSKIGCEGGFEQGNCIPIPTLSFAQFSKII